MKAAQRRVASGKVLEGYVRDVTQAGDAVVETPAGIVMVRGALPHEQVRLRVHAVQRGTAHGALLAVLSPSPDRVQPACVLAERCGGCPLMPLSQPAQHALKLARVRRALAGLAPDAVPGAIEAAGPALGYRRRARFGFRRVGAGVVLGYHAPASRLLLDVSYCPILEPPLTAALATLRAELAPTLTGSGELELACAAAGAVTVRIVADKPQPADAYRRAEALVGVGPIAGVALQVQDGAAARFGDVTAAERGADGSALRLALGGFSQVNARVNVRLGELVCELAEPRDARVLELYAGHGNFTVALAASARELVAVEGDPAAAAACRANLAARGQRARVLAHDVSKLQLRERFDALVLDPPRAGAPALAAIVAAMRPERVVYVSCHMTTLGRDLRSLQQQGYRLDRAHALDMFPHTAHVEAVVRLHHRPS